MKRKYKYLIMVMLIIVYSCTLIGCLPGIGHYSSGDPAGFFSGIWHGWMAPFTLIMSLFSDIQFYEIINTGFTYNLGFYIAIISGFGGISFFRK